MTKDLFFNYRSASKIRIKKENCLYNEQFPYVFRIKTAKLDFLIPRAAVILTKQYAVISLEQYRLALTNLYKSINYGSI